MYLDQGYEVSAKFIERNIISDLENVIKNKLYKDAKSLFQERSQEKTGITPIYKVLNESGPDHDKIFEVGVYIGENLAGTGSGPSKQDAEQKAAEDALSK